MRKLLELVFPTLLRYKANLQKLREWLDAVTRLSNCELKLEEKKAYDESFAIGREIFSRIHNEMQRSILKTLKAAANQRRRLEKKLNLPSDHKTGLALHTLRGYIHRLPWAGNRILHVQDGAISHGYGDKIEVATRRVQMLKEMDIILQIAEQELKAADGYESEPVNYNGRSEAEKPGKLTETFARKRQCEEAEEQPTAH